MNPSAAMMKPLQIVHIESNYIFFQLCVTAAFLISAWYLYFYTRLSKTPVCGLYPSVNPRAHLHFCSLHLSSLRTKRTKHITFIGKKFPLLTSCHLLCFSFIFKPSHLYPDVQLTFPLHFKTNLPTFYIHHLWISRQATALLFFQKKYLQFTVSRHFYLSFIHLPGILYHFHCNSLFKICLLFNLGRACFDHLSTHAWALNTAVQTEQLVVPLFRMWFDTLKLIKESIFNCINFIEISRVSYHHSHN